MPATVCTCIGNLTTTLSWHVHVPDPTCPYHKKESPLPAAGGVRSALSRALFTAALALLLLWVVGDQMLDAITIDEAKAGGIALGAVVVSVLVSVAGRASSSAAGGPSVGTGLSGGR